MLWSNQHRSSLVQLLVCSGLRHLYTTLQSSRFVPCCCQVQPASAFLLSCQNSHPLKVEVFRWGHLYEPTEQSGAVQGSHSDLHPCWRCLQLLEQLAAVEGEALYSVDWIERWVCEVCQLKGSR